MYSNIARFMMLIEEAKSALVNPRDGDDRTFYSTLFGSLDTLQSYLVSHITQSNMEAFKPLITDDKISILELLSRELRQTYRSNFLSEDTRQQMLQDVRKLKEDVLFNEHLSLHEKNYIVKLLHDVERALQSYWLGGFDDVASTVAALGGGAAVVTDQAQRGWFMSGVLRIWEFLNVSADGVRALSATGSEVVALIDEIEHLTQ